MDVYDTMCIFGALGLALTIIGLAMYLIFDMIKDSME